MKNLIIKLSLLIFLYSCKKTSSTDSLNKITGKMLLCINGVESPYLTNKPIDLFQQRDGSNFKSQVLANTTIDSVGNFTFSYSTNNTYDKLIIRETGGFGFNPVVTRIPIEGISNLKVYYSARYNLVVNLNAIKPYTNLDTLYVLKGDFLNTLKIPGPFINRRLYRINSFPVLPEMIYGNNGDNVKASLNNNVDLTKGYVIENNKLCGDTVYVNIDVR